MLKCKMTGAALRARASAAVLTLSIIAVGASAGAQSVTEFTPKLPSGAVESSPQAVAVSLRPQMRDDRLPKARWGDSVQWTRAMVTALRGHAEPLVDTVPHDIDDWCPAYEQNNDRLREAFWVGLVSSLAKHESTWRPTVVGGGGRWHGLLQILPSTARLYGCRAQSGSALLSGPPNLSCGLRIMAKTVRRDGVVSAGMRGVAADWGPFHSRAKRADMMAYTRNQAFCKVVPSTRPELRPGRWDAPVMARAQHHPLPNVPVLSTQSHDYDR